MLGSNDVNRGKRNRAVRITGNNKSSPSWSRLFFPLWVLNRHSKTMISGYSKAVSNIKRITHTMQLIATARFQTALKRATAAKPYTEKIAELVGELAGAGGNVDHPPWCWEPGSSSTS